MSNIIKLTTRDLEDLKKGEEVTVGDAVLKIDPLEANISKDTFPRYTLENHAALMKKYNKEKK